MSKDVDVIALSRGKKESLFSSASISDETFISLLKGYETILYKMAFIYVRNEHDALEMVSETVYKGYKNKKSLKDENLFCTWITKILINTCINYLKRNKRLTHLEKILDKDEAVGLPQDLPENTILLDEALSCLKPQYKTVLLLRFYQDFSIKQTSKVMGVPENTVKTYTRRALTELKKLIKEDDFYE